MNTAAAWTLNAKLVTLCVHDAPFVVSAACKSQGYKFNV